MWVPRRSSVSPNGPDPRIQQGFSPLPTYMRLRVRRPTDARLPLMLRELSFQEDYRTGEDDLLNDFLRPSLTQANRYWRAAGYFSSSAFESWGKPLRDF